MYICYEIHILSLEDPAISTGSIVCQVLEGLMTLLKVLSRGASRLNFEELQKFPLQVQDQPRVPCTLQASQQRKEKVHCNSTYGSHQIMVGSHHLNPFDHELLSIIPVGLIISYLKKNTMIYPCLSMIVP